MIWNRQTAAGEAGNQPADSEAGEGRLQPDIAAAISAMARAVPDPFVVLDAAGNVITVNDPAAVVLGRVSVGEHLSQYIRAPQVLQAISAAVETGHDQEVSYERRTGAPRLFNVKVTLIGIGPIARGAPGTPAIAVFLRDLTAQNNLERMRVDFVANASHELRTPLTSLTGYIETLQGPAREDVAARDKFLACMLEQAHRMRRLIDDLLSLSSIEMNLHLSPSDPVDMSDVARYSGELLSNQAQQAGCEIRIEAPSGLMVAGDRDQLVQVCHNLLENALKYGSSDRGIDVKVKRNAQGNRIELSVIDTGVGISAQHLPRLTERFYRVNTQASRSTGGTGLGLAIVKHIALRHRGRLDVRSVEGKGSTFTLDLPAVPAELGSS